MENPVGLVFETQDPNFSSLFTRMGTWVLDNFEIGGREVEMSANSLPEIREFRGSDGGRYPVTYFTTYTLKITFYTDESYNLFRLMFVGTGYEKYLRTTFWGDIEGVLP